MKRLFINSCNKELNKQENNKGNVLNNIVDVKINPYITDDLELLQKYYTVLLDYVNDLEKKMSRIKKEKEILERKILWLEKEK